MKKSAINILLTGMLCCAVLAAHAQVKVIDATNGNIVILAQIQDTKGRLVGFTDKEGKIPSDIKATEGLTIQHMAYETYKLTQADIEAQTAALNPRTYNVDEVVVKGNDQDYIYLRGYYRKYSTYEMLDSLEQEYTEGMLEYVIKNKKLSTPETPIVLTADIYTLKSKGDTIAKTSYQHNEKKTQSKARRFLPSMGSELLINSDETEKLNFSLTADTLQGKFWPKAYFSKSGPTISVGTDNLADKEDHSMRFPLLNTLLGIDMKFTDMNNNQLYHLHENGKYRFSSLVGLSHCVKALIGGKRVAKLVNKTYDANVSKKDHPMTLYYYSEVYFTDMEYISKEKAKEIKKHEGFDDSVEMVVPGSASALSPAMVSLKQIILDKNEK